MIKKTMIFLLASAAVFTACKKTETTLTTTQKVLGKWTYVGEAGTQTYQGTTKPTSYTATAGDYADFRTDGKMYSRAQGNYFDTTTYFILNDTLIKIKKDTATIKTLTTSSFVFHYKRATPDFSSESTVTLKK